MNRIIFTLWAVLFLAQPSYAHHSDTGLNLDEVVLIRGKITEFSWRNPHVYFKVDAYESTDKTGIWEFQMASTPPLSRAGWGPNSLVPGDEVVVRGHPAIDGRRYGLLESLEKDGKVMSTSVAAAREAAVAESLEGIWRGDRSTIGDFTLFFDRIVPNEKGAAAQGSFNALSDDNPMASCLGRPTPSTLASAGGYLSEIEYDGDIIYLRNEIFDVERTVYMDGRPHPENGERTLHGHSIGWWEGDTLVVDAVNFSDHRSPYQNGIPSGAQKHVVEKYRLSEDGHRIIVDLMLEDPEFIAEPLITTMEWIYSPDAQMVAWNCDEESTKTFLPR